MSKKKWNVVNVDDLIREDDRNDLVRHPNKGKIQEEWGATCTGTTYRIGPLYQTMGQGGFSRKPFLDRTEFCVGSMEKLEELARDSGLRVDEYGSYDLDGILEKHYIFRKLK